MLKLCRCICNHQRLPFLVARPTALTNSCLRIKQHLISWMQLWTVSIKVLALTCLVVFLSHANNNSVYPQCGAQFSPTPSFDDMFHKRVSSEQALSSPSADQSPESSSTSNDTTSQQAPPKPRRWRHICTECAHVFITPSKVSQRMNAYQSIRR